MAFWCYNLDVGGKHVSDKKKKKGKKMMISPHAGAIMASAIQYLTIIDEFLLDEKFAKLQAQDIIIFWLRAETAEA